MHSKVINPAIHGKKAYDNKGSCGALVHYLGHEAKEKGELLTFFNGNRENIPASDVQQGIDGNVKGVRKREVKFYSLVISPSAEELKHIGNNEDKLKTFTRQAMQNYASNFKLKNGKTLDEQDLVWYATIHHGRTYKGNDKAVKSGQVKAGELKPGLHTHVHILVSKRDQSQQVSLNPQGSRDRFYMKKWQRLNEQSFEKLFGYEKKQSTQKSFEQKPKRLAGFQHHIQKKVEIINGMLSTREELSLKAVLWVAEKRNYEKTFFYNLNRLEKDLRKGNVVHQPMHLLEHNKDKKPAPAEKQSVAHAIGRVFHALSGESLGKTEDLAMPAIESRHRKKRQVLQEVRKGGMSR
jgi:hypothetical protein